MSEQVQVRLADDEWAMMEDNYVRSTMLPETYETYREALALGQSPGEAMLLAVRNEATNEILFDHVIREVADRIGLLAAKKAGAFDTPVKKHSEQLIWVTFQKEGVHLYPAAATDPKLKTGGWDDVSFLGVPHRHIFHFRVSMEVFHDDRDVEFIQFKRWLERLYSEGTLELNHKSCEMISEDLYDQIIAKYPDRKIIIEVSEDGENGSVTTYERD